MYTFYWLDGKRDVLEGDSISNAFLKAGYGAGAMAALDFICNGDNNEYCWNKNKNIWIKKEVRAINSYNTDWYQWGVNGQILGYDETKTKKILKFGLEHYTGTEEDSNLFWKGYYS